MTTSSTSERPADAERPAAERPADAERPAIQPRVEHPLHGVGVVESWRRGGRVAVVRFERQPLPIELPARELGLHSATPAAHQDRAAAQALSGRLGAALSGSFEQGSAMLTLEAMRLGVVPSAQLDAYTVGRDFEMSLVDGDLEATRQYGGAVRAFLGDYGVGKTHLLELVLHRALEKNFLTARVVLDPEETSPAHPKRVYRAAVRSLQYPDRPFEEGAGLEPLLELAARSPTALAAFGLEAPGSKKKSAAGGDRAANPQHLYLSAALAYFASLERVQHSLAEKKPIAPRGVPPAEVGPWSERARELLSDWVEGHPTISNQDIDQELNRLPGRHPRVYSLLDFRPWSRIYGYLLSGVARLAREVGYAGLVLLIDEAEFYGLLSPKNREFARDLFKAWCWAAMGPGGQHDDQPRLPFAEDELGVGGYGVQRDLPARFSDAPGLYVVFAMTPSGDGVDALRGALPQSCISQLSALEPVDYTELARRVCDFYASARPDWSLPEALVGPLAKVLRGLIQSGYVQNPRHAMKFIIEFLDVVRYHPDRVASVVRNLQDTLMF